MTDMRGFWQVSDDVPPEVFQAFTKDCPRDDCCMSARTGETTCAGTWNHYNKDGQKIITDRNRFTIHVCCSECWMYAKVNDKGEISDKQYVGS